MTLLIKDSEYVMFGTKGQIYNKNHAYVVSIVEDTRGSMEFDGGGIRFIY